MTSIEKPHTTPQVQIENTTPIQQESGLSVASLVLGIISLTGPGLLLGIPAIIMGAISLKKQQTGRGLSIAGIVTGALSTFVSLIVIALVIFFFIYSAQHPEEFYTPSPSPQNNALFEGSKT